MNSHTRVIEFLALKRNTALLLGALVLAGMGERLWPGFAPKYLETLGAAVCGGAGTLWFWWFIYRRRRLRS